MRPLHVLLLALGCILPFTRVQSNASATPAKPDKTQAKGDKKPPHLDRSRKAKKGEASFYGRKFYGKKMANGEPMKPDSNNAASKTLPLGTKAQVTNLETGKSAVVVVKDRGPYIDGRLIDVSPKTAEKLDFKEDGVAPVVVKPLVVPKENEKEKGKEKP